MPLRKLKVIDTMHGDEDKDYYKRMYEPPEALLLLLKTIQGRSFLSTCLACV